MNISEKKLNIDLSGSTIIKIIGIFLLLAFLYLIKDIVAIIIISVVVASGLNPWIDKMNKKNIPRSVAVLTIYLVIIGLIALTIALIIPPITNQIKQISGSFPAYYDKILELYSGFQKSSGMEETVQNSLNSQSNTFAQLGGGLVTFSTHFLGGLVTFFAVLVIVFYLTVGEANIREFFKSMAPKKYQPYLVQKSNQIQAKLGMWLRGQMILCLIIFVMTYAGLLLMGVKYALVLALIAGFLEVIPVLGPLLSGVPAVLIAFTQSPIKALLVIILYIVIQQTEENVMVPKIMQKSVGVSPIIIIIIMLIGAKIGGVIGILLAVPVATIVKIFLDDYFQDKKVKEEKLET